MKYSIIISILIIGVVAAYCFLGLDYTKQQKAQEKIALETSSVAARLVESPMPPQDLEQKLVAAQASLAAVQSEFPGKPNSTQVINKILKLADECQVRAIPLATQQWSSDTNGKGFMVFRLHITVSGGFSQSVSFVSKLESGVFSTLVIENLSVTRMQEPAQEEKVSDMAEPVTASLDVAIYAKSADAD